MKSSTEKQLREAFNKGFESTHRIGLVQGAIAIAKVVLDKANNENKAPEDRLDDIIKFCEKSLHNIDTRRIKGE